MATPYFQLRLDSVPSTQDVALHHLDQVPVVVMTPHQSEGRGRSGSGWQTADRALAVSIAMRVHGGDRRPFSLMSGVALARVLDGISLKWPNDIFVDGLKAGGILVERSSEVMVVGLGLNLWWRSTPNGVTALYAEDPGVELHARIGSLWCAEVLAMIDQENWPIDEYRSHSVTLGRSITWEPAGEGIAIDVGGDGGLLVEISGGAQKTIYSGAVAHVRI